MNIWENAIVTDAGKGLLAKLVEGNTLTITRAETGEGYVSPSVLSTQTAVLYPKQALTFSAVSYPEEGKCKLVCKLTNDSLSGGYTAKQVGVYATDPDKGEILFMIVQALTGEGTIVPSAAEMPAFSAEWSLYFQFGQASGVSVIVDPSNAVSRGDMEAYVTDKLKDVKIPVDSSLDPNSENPVQNKVVAEVVAVTNQQITQVRNEMAEMNEQVEEVRMTANNNTLAISAVNSRIAYMDGDIANVIPTIAESNIDTTTDYGFYKVEGSYKKYWLFVPLYSAFPCQTKIDEYGEIYRREGSWIDVPDGNSYVYWYDWGKATRKVTASTTDLNAGMSALNDGDIYLVYE